MAINDWSLELSFEVYERLAIGRSTNSYKIDKWKL